jgi:chromosome segregation ATPase
MALMASSCVQKTKYEELQQENALLKAEKEKSASELSEVLTTLNDVEESIASVKDAENYLNIRRSGEINATTKEQIAANVKLIAETLKANKEQLAQLQEKLKTSELKSSALTKTINRLNAEINEKAVMIASLQEELIKKDIRISELDETVEVLTADIGELTDENKEKSDQLYEQDRQLNRAFYCYGTRKELKEQNILTGGGLFSKPKALQQAFNKDYFKAIDIRDVTEIQLFDRKAAIRTNHPTDSYEFVKDESGSLTLHITDIAKFWSLSEYLVIEIG